MEAWRIGAMACGLFIVGLGGEVYRLKNYGDLLTAVVYPDHIVTPRYREMLKAVGKNPDLTPMPYFGDTMTVDELTDLVAFLHDQYTLLLPNDYRGVYPAVP